MNLGVFLKEFWDTVALQFFELVEEFLPTDPPAFAARMPCSTTPNRAQGHHPVATSTTNLRRSFLATVCRMPGTAWLRGRLLKRSVIALSYSVGK